MIDDGALGTVLKESPKSAMKKNIKRKRSDDDDDEPKRDCTIECLERRSEEEENDDFDDDDNNSCGEKRGVLSVNVENEEKKIKKIKKSVNFSLNHLEDVAGVADDIDREAWELPRTCDGCGLYILGERWSCGKCLEETEEEFDFCKACFVAFMEVESKDGGGGDTSVGSKSHNTNNNNPWGNIDGGGAVQLTSEDLHKHDSNSFLKFDEENEESIANVEMKKAVEQ